MLLLLFAIGASIGSFVYAFALRYPDESWVYGRSKCEHCGSALGWKDLAPVVSFLLLRGKCRRCHKFIGWEYILIELFFGYFLVRLWQLPQAHLKNGIKFFIFSSLFILLFSMIALVDYQKLIIPDILVVALAVFAVSYRLFFELPVVVWVDNIIMAFLLGGILFLIWIMSKGRWLGFGDVKLAPIIGFLFGFPDSLWIVYLAVGIGAIVGLIFILGSRFGYSEKEINKIMKIKIPLGSLLSLSSIALILFPVRISSFFFKILLLFMYVR